MSYCTAWRLASPTPARLTLLPQDRQELPQRGRTQGGPKPVAENFGAVLPVDDLGGLLGKRRRESLLQGHQDVLPARGQPFLPARVSSPFIDQLRFEHVPLLEGSRPGRQ